MFAKTLGSSRISSGEPVLGLLSVVINTIGKLLSVKVCEKLLEEEIKKITNKTLTIVMRFKDKNRDIST